MHMISNVYSTYCQIRLQTYIALFDHVPRLRQISRVLFHRMHDDGITAIVAP